VGNKKLGFKDRDFVKSKDGCLAGGLGFEPRQPESESGVLPLDDPPSRAEACGVICLADMRVACKSQSHEALLN
jgi:hypothetical protein